MTSLPAQIEAVREIISSNGTVKFIWPRDVEIWRAVLVTLQQHERLEATVAELETAYQNCAELAMTYHGQRERLEAALRNLVAVAPIGPSTHVKGAFLAFHSAMDEARAAIDTVASETPTDNCLVEPAITPEMLRAGISVAEAHFLRAHGAWRDLVVAVYRAMYLSRPSPSGETEATLSREDIAENTGNPR